LRKDFHGLGFGFSVSSGKGKGIITSTYEIHPFVAAPKKSLSQKDERNFFSNFFYR
jgi:hypothetical protein